MLFNKLIKFFVRNIVTKSFEDLFNTFTINTSGPTMIEWLESFSSGYLLWNEEIWWSSKIIIPI